MKNINLKSLSVDELLNLRDRINSLLESRVDHERRELQTRLKRLQRFSPEKARTRRDKPAANGTIVTQSGRQPTKSKSKSTKKVAPKYRNPDNSSETWSGRGLQPRWMRAAIDGGKSKEDFAI
jgi:DNA-binding protein H-NS